ncbi:MAG: hypothetical protein GY926_04270, partial [bacterium]|nr:hypothetical protein [bacterium]
MDPRTLQLIQRALVAAVTVVLALVVVTAFVRVLEPADETIAARPTTTSPTTTEPATTTSTTLGTGVTTTTSDLGTAVCLDEEPSSTGSTVLQVFYPCGSTDLAIGGTYVLRAVTKTDLVLTTTLRQMTKGLEPEEAALGFKSPFPSEADGSFLGVSLSEGTAFLEFDDNIFPPGADTPEGAQIFLSTLNANVFQFDTISKV